MKIVTNDYSFGVLKLLFSTSIGLYGYYVLSKTEPEYDSVETRYRLMYTHKEAKKDGFDIPTYNAKMRRLETVNENLKRVQDPLRLQLPIRQIRTRSTSDLY